MAGKIKGIYKGFKSISYIFVVKEREMEIGHPTDVKHVAHVGVGHSSTVPPSWMNEFKFGPDTTTTSTDNTNVSHPTTPSIDNSKVSHLTTLSKRSSQGLDQSIESQPTTKKMRNQSCTDLPNVTKKRKRRKKNNSVAESSSTKSRRMSKTKETSTQLSLSPNIEI
ncbi:hypothetical protein HRI_005129200 [Hibiscus trionum]|uniref:CRIB domain-containing protein n=1 Tax=Hibiscus trionum TaxID=183268 RepID=A0A9W7JHH2_HIBTR|nr:hypothetical protein HRI_005129200 [Hibiscus trionum]